MTVERNGVIYQKINDASITLGISNTTLRKWVVGNKIPYIKMGQKYMIDIDGARKILQNWEVK